MGVVEKAPGRKRIGNVCEHSVGGCEGLDLRLGVQRGSGTDWGLPREVRIRSLDGHTYSKTRQRPEGQSGVGMWPGSCRACVPVWTGNEDRRESQR